VADNAEYREKLKEKLLEEVKEFCESESIEELADILEVIDAISNLKKFAHTQIQSIRTTKIDERGAFTKKIILEKVSMAVENEAVSDILHAEQEARDGKILRGNIKELAKNIST